MNVIMMTVRKREDTKISKAALMQKPDASYIAGFNTWKNEFIFGVVLGVVFTCFAPLYAFQ